MSRMDPNRFIESLLDTYPGDENMPKIPLVPGSYMGTIDEAKAHTQEDWRKVFGKNGGIPYPPEFSYDIVTIPDYTTLTRIEKLQHRAVRRYNRNAWTELGGPEINNHLSLIQVQKCAAWLCQNAYSTVFAADTVRRPDLSVPEAIDPMPHIPTAYAKTSESGVSFNALHGAIATFGMNAAHYFPDRVDAKRFNTHYPFALAANRRHGNRTNAISLPWLLNVLTTVPSQDRVLRVVTTIGCDFGDIQTEVIDKVRRKDPAARFTLNAVLASEYAPGSVLPVAVIGNDAEGNVIVNNPQYQERQTMPPDIFWSRWTQANMQSVITAAASKSTMAATRRRAG